MEREEYRGKGKQYKIDLKKNQELIWFKCRKGLRRKQAFLMITDESKVFHHSKKDNVNLIKRIKLTILNLYFFIILESLIDHDEDNDVETDEEQVDRHVEDCQIELKRAIEEFCEGDPI